MNTEKIVLRMTADEADKIAFVLMASLQTVTMLDSERKTTVTAVNSLFGQLNYRMKTDDYGQRIDLEERE